MYSNIIGALVIGSFIFVGHKVYKYKKNEICCDYHSPYTPAKLK
ncbi:FeoB-associated Cys-rich membrane protein [Clostridium botulinum]|uniref:FeoB-associated Cys-rich membrane protein n=1 Tax=Clostridium botulinum TaxID=1491 RepID=A0AAU8Z5R7_CLOBO|nr:FeoB-associated Cys-rich membrane protein [Clostridium botulinum]MBE6055996.1 FeoB-associated Cys-rich membrane protein [Clostridium sp.]NFD92786.1 FeoB-associated Cys-rich membrane protein [Clostridium sporogenes]NFE44105.1 FeoB-associated Cys-rich membrane protein [Clostridium sporogenes]NFF14830.1 FeoB-associated Cys-rich membrane protein [Clostridium sporogenes]